MANILPMGAVQPEKAKRTAQAMCVRHDCQLQKTGNMGLWGRQTLSERMVKLLEGYGG